MRDDQINRMNEVNTRRILAIINQLEFVNMRMMATEQIIFDRWALLKALLIPGWLRREVDFRHLELIAEADKKRSDMNKPPIIKPVTIMGNGHG